MLVIVFLQSVQSFDRTSVVQIGVDVAMEAFDGQVVCLIYGKHRKTCCTYNKFNKVVQSAVSMAWKRSMIRSIGQAILSQGYRETTGTARNSV